MAGETNTDKIRGLERDFATLDERVRNLRRDFDRVEELVQGLDRSVQGLDRTLTAIQADVKRHETRLEEMRSRRWDLWKIAIAAVVGSLLTLAIGFVSRRLDR